MSSSHQFAIMSLHAGQKNDHEECANYLSHSAISSIDSGKGSMYLEQAKKTISQSGQQIFNVFSNIANCFWKGAIVCCKTHKIAFSVNVKL